MDILSINKRLDPMFRAKSIAVVGASEGKLGGVIVTNLQATYDGVIYPINPKKPEIYGLPAFKSVLEVPEHIDLVLVAVPARFCVGVIEQCAEKEVGAAVIISAGFKEVGELELEKELISAAAGKFPILGPNTLGVLCNGTDSKYNASFSSEMTLPGRICLLSQSGALCTSTINYAKTRNIGFSACISIGNASDVSFGDLVSYFGEDENTDAIVLYAEALGHDFFAAARKTSLRKPIILLKGGASEESKAAAESHTGSLSGGDAALDAALERVGVVRVREMAQLFGLADILAKQPFKRNITREPTCTIVTNAGGPGVCTVDALVNGGGKLAPIDSIMDELNSFLPNTWSHGNPIDVIGDSRPERYAKTMAACAKNKDSDGTLVILTPQDMTDPTGTARAVIEHAKNSPVPVLASWMGGPAVAEGARLLSEAGIPTFPFPDQATEVFNIINRYHSNLRNLYEEPYVDARDVTYDKETARRMIDQCRADGRKVLSEYESKKVLAAYNIPVCITEIALTPEEAGEWAEKIGYPCVVKIHSEIITHKSDVGGVQLNLKSREEVVAAFHLIRENVEKVRGHYGNKSVDELVLGVTVQKMINTKGAFELILGCSMDVELGPVLLFGMGGTLCEVLKDTALGLPPLSHGLARQLMEKTKIFEALKGVRGAKPCDIEALERILVDLSILVVDFPEIAELDINPLLISPEELTAVDARVLLTGPEDLVIAPIATGYPREFVKEHNDIIIRPIRPTDDDQIQALEFETNSVYSSFFNDFPINEKLDSGLSGLCFVDYNYEMAFVAEKNDKLCALARLSKRDNGVEFALVVDRLVANEGIGSQLMESIEAFAACKNHKTIYGHLPAHAEQAAAFLEKRGYTIKNDVAVKTL
ncbi:hypothetical protein PCE1_000226 [Barthelona sp. PCE]